LTQGRTRHEAGRRRALTAAHHYGQFFPTIKSSGDVIRPSEQIAHVRDLPLSATCRPNSASIESRGYTAIAGDASFPKRGNDRQNRSRELLGRNQLSPSPRCSCPAELYTPLFTTLSRHPGGGIPLPRQRHPRYRLWPHLHAPKEDKYLDRAGQRLGIKEVDDGIWLVSFMHYDLGYIDLEQRTLQTIDNPFGTRLSPTS
jgi:hypothetical protein